MGWVINIEYKSSVGKGKRFWTRSKRNWSLARYGYHTTEPYSKKERTREK